MIHEYTDLSREIGELIIMAADYKEINRKMLDIFKAFKDNIKQRKEEYAKLEIEAEKLNELIKTKATMDFFKRKVDLMVEILEANGCNDVDALTFDFWNECVEPSDFQDVLQAAMSKDAEPEKKKTSTTLTKAG